jgi:hypothetical protein
MKILLLLAFFISGARAHDGGENYLRIEYSADGQLKAEWALPTSFVQDLFLEQPATREQILESAKLHRAEIALLTGGDLEISGDGQSCPLRLVAQTERIINEKPFAILGFEGACKGKSPRSLAVSWKYLSSDPHLIPLLISLETASGIRSELGSNQVGETFVSLEPQSAGFLKFIVGGIFHIWGGVDHLLFLLTLLLPAVYFLSQKDWQVREHAASMWLDVLKTISAFTLAHSITLCLVTFGFLSLPSRLVESLIALSVLLAGLNNLFPLAGEGRWKLAFLFGLVHGVGFAEVLTGLGLPLRALLLALVGYNLGVEIGQLAIVLAFLPMAYYMRGTSFYRRIIFSGGSALASLVAALWLVDRVFQLRFMPF